MVGFVVSYRHCFQWTCSLWQSTLQPVSKPTPQLGSLQVQTVWTPRPGPSFTLGDITTQGSGPVAGRQFSCLGWADPVNLDLHRPKLLPRPSSGIETVPVHEAHTWFSNPALFQVCVLSALWYLGHFLLFPSLAIYAEALGKIATHFLCI